MSDHSQVLARLGGVFTRFFNNPQLTLTPSTTARDVPGWDSLANVELMIEVEEEFGVRFRTGEVAGLKNVGELLSVITRRMQG